MKVNDLVRIIGDYYINKANSPDDKIYGIIESIRKDRLSIFYDVKIIYTNSSILTSDLAYLMYSYELELITDEEEIRRITKLMIFQ